MERLAALETLRGSGLGSNSEPWACGCYALGAGGAIPFHGEDAAELA